MLEILEEPKGNIYEKLIKYLCENNDVLMFVNRTDSVARILIYFDIICNELNLNEKQLMKEYKTNGLKNIFNKIRYKKEIFLIDEWIEEKSSEHTREEIIKIKENIIKMIFENYLINKEQYNLQQSNINRIKKLLKPYLLKERHNPEWCGTYSEFDGIKLPKYRDDYIYDICFYRISKEVEEFLLETVDSLYKWDPPYLPQDISFFKNVYCNFKSITHEDIAYIKLKNNKEYKYLENIGLKLQKEYEDCYNKNNFLSENYIL